MSESGWADKPTVLDAVNRNGLDLQQASPGLQADKDVVTEAVKRDGMALQFASEELRGDKGVVLAAVRKYGAAFQYAGAELRSDKAVVLEAVVAEKENLKWWQRGPVSIRFASDELRANKIFMLEIVKHDGRALEYGSSELRADKEVVLEAVKQRGDAIQYASEELRDNKEVVLEAVKQNGTALTFATKQLRADRDLVVEAVKRSSRVLLYVSEELRADKELQLLAARFLGPPGGDYFEEVLEAFQNDVGVEMDSKAFERLTDNFIAVRGEEAPIVTVTLSLCGGSTRTFKCEASLMGGLTFSCSIPDAPCEDSWRDKRPGPVLDMLASKLVDELWNNSEATERVFISFLGAEDEDFVAVTPWDWERPLSDFLPRQTP